jgi:hypothetical protein
MPTAAPAKQSASLMLSLFDGTRQPFPAGIEVLVTVLDGNQKQ